MKTLFFFFTSFILYGQVSTTLLNNSITTSDIHNAIFVNFDFHIDSLTIYNSMYAECKTKYNYKYDIHNRITEKLLTPIGDSGGYCRNDYDKSKYFYENEMLKKKIYYRIDESDSDNVDYVHGVNNYIYDNNNNLVSLIEEGSNSRDETYHRFYEYDISNNLKIYTDTSFISDSHVNTTFEQYYFYTENNFVDSISSSKKIPNFDIDYTKKFIYNSSQRLVKLIEDKVILDHDKVPPQNRFLTTSSYLYDDTNMLSEIKTSRYERELVYKDTAGSGYYYFGDTYTFQDSSRKQYLYNSSGNIIEVLEMDWDNVWSNNNRIIYNYNQNGNYLKIISEKWEGSWIPFQRTFEFLDGEGNLFNLKCDGLEVYSSDLTKTQDEKKSINKYTLSQNYPNPFNPTTTISYSIPKQSNTSLKVFNVLGREVKTLVNEVKSIGNYKIDFNASSLPSGIYFYRLQSNDFSVTKKLILVK